MAVALLPLDAPAPRRCSTVACALDAAALATFETALHGRGRDASRGGEGWLGTCRSARRARLVGTPAADLAVVIAARLVEGGLVEAVASSVEDARDAAARGARRLVFLGGPCRVHALRQAEPVPGLEALYVIGTGTVSGAAAPTPDAVNALADLSILAAGPPDAWAVVRNARGRAMLDRLEADLSLDAIGPAAFAAVAARVAGGPA